MRVIKNLCDYRELFKSNIKKEIRGKYKGSFLGILWSFINPLLQVFVYSIVFSYVMRTQIDNYLVYVVCGIIPWTFFTTGVNQGMVTVRSNASIIKKVYFPREILPISVVASGLVNFLISCIIILIFTIGSGLGINWMIILVPVIALLQTLFTLGIVLICSAVNVYIKDLEYIVQFILNMAFYATPILYDISIFPTSLRWVLSLNPLAHIVNAYRDIFMYHQLISLNSWIYMIIISVLFLVIGFAIFNKLQKGFAEEI